MYIPSYANPPNETFLKDLVNNYPFVTLISVDEKSEPYITHLPVVAQFDGADQLVKIQGHLSKFNPHYEILKNNKIVKVIFNGPHQYISPRWYKSGRDVPTWAYCVVHIQGDLTLEDSFEDICRNLKDLTEKFELGEEAWSFELPSDLQDPEALTRAISAFSIVPTKIESKFKLNQKRPMIDQLSVIKALGAQNDEMSLAVRDLMKRVLPSEI